MAERQQTDAMAHDLRVEIVDLLGGMELRGEEIGGYLPGLPDFPTVSYHLRVLERAGLVERVGGVWRTVRPTRGA